MGITHVITLYTDTNIIGWINMMDGTNDIANYIILNNDIIPNSPLGSTKLKLLDYEKSSKNILSKHQSYIYSIYENQATKNILGTIAINPIYINEKGFKVVNNKIYLYNKLYEKYVASISGNGDVILTYTNVPDEVPEHSTTYDFGGARRNKKRTRRHKNNKKRDKRTRSRKTRNNRRKH